MRIRKIFGCVLLISGILILILPYIYGFTGFFYTLYAINSKPISSMEHNLFSIIFSAALVIIGYFLIKPEEKIRSQVGK